jgi:hypothetical protein
MENFVFKPKYRLNFYFGLASGVVMFLLLLWIIVDTQDFSFQSILWLGIMILIPLIILSAFIRSITFESQSFTVSKFLFLSKTYEYTEIVDFSKRMIKTERGTIALTWVKNNDEFYDKMTHLLNEGRINNQKIEHRLVPVENMARKAFFPSIVVTIILWLIITWKFHIQQSFASDIGFGLLFIITFYFMMKWQSRKKKGQ